jgi:FkbM family methyltransferase
MRPLASGQVFLALLRLTRPAVIADVGSCDGHESLRFKRVLPRARVIAFEANPVNAKAMQHDRALSGIEIRAVAVTDSEGPVSFYVLPVPDDKPWARGASSLLERRPEHSVDLPAQEVEVRAIRLDEAVAATSGRIAVWIDVEGAADRVLRGMEGIWDRVVAVHIETEHTPVWHDQADGWGVWHEIESRGFRRVALAPNGPFQYDAAFMRNRPVIRALWIAYLVATRIHYAWRAAWLRK